MIRVSPSATNGFVAFLSTSLPLDRMSAYALLANTCPQSLTYVVQPGSHENGWTDTQVSR